MTQSKLNNTLKNFSWRVDVKTSTKVASAHKQELNDPVAIAEFIIGKPSTATGDAAAEQTADDKVVRLEMTRDQVLEALAQINQIQTQIEKIAGQ